MLCTRENTDVFFTLDDNIYGIHSKSKYPLWFASTRQANQMSTHNICFYKLVVVMSTHNTWFYKENQNRYHKSIIKYAPQKSSLHIPLKCALIRKIFYYTVLQ